MIYPIIMAGGTGSRLWPLSREACPKQFLAINNELSMLQQTFQRLSGIDNKPPIVICNEEHRFIAAEQIRVRAEPHSGIILEPCGRNTAPAIALAAMRAILLQPEDDPVLLVMAADHVIERVSAFEQAVADARAHAESGKLVTFGIVPTAPETGYGYIQAEGNVSQSVGPGLRVKKFVEKPDLERAKNYLSSKCYYWNSGMFLFKASSFLSELKKYNPEIYNVCEKALSNSISDKDFIHISELDFKECPNISIDYAVMERTQKAVVVPMDAGWSDIGSWSALWDISEKDQNSNVVKGDVIAVDSTNSYFHSNSKLIAAVGVDDLIVIETNDSVLVSNKEHVQQVKLIVENLKSSNRTEYQRHREDYRPWGKIELLDSSKCYQVKRITINPGKKLSTQVHSQRSEHWTVISGRAKVTKGADTFYLSSAQSTSIPKGVVHSLSNESEEPLEIVEVQAGIDIQESDIVRFSEDFSFDQKVEIS